MFVIRGRRTKGMSNEPKAQEKEKRRSSGYATFTILKFGGDFKRSKPRTTDLRPWLWGASLRGSSEHSSPDSRPERSVVRGKKENPHLSFSKVQFSFIVISPYYRPNRNGHSGSVLFPDAPECTLYTLHQPSGLLTL